jgi:hypothetical protein
MAVFIDNSKIFFHKNGRNGRKLDCIKKEAPAGPFGNANPKIPLPT